jgi:hypothetical protein
MRKWRQSGGAGSHRLRSLAAIVTALALVAGCGASVTTSPPTEGRSPGASASTQPTPTQPLATPSATLRAISGRWEPAGTMAVGRVDSHAVLLGDGRVLVVGIETSGHRDPGVLDDTAKAEVWDPASGAWHTTESLNKPRGKFVAVPLADGRVLIAGGLNQSGQSYSSTYIYDPRPGHESWSNVGLLGTARTAPMAAMLPDGRVLVAGGWYQAGPGRSSEAAPAAELAAYRPGSIPGADSFRPRVADIDPEIFTSALATAELFDPATGKWSATGALKYARIAPTAVTLADGRILVVGSNQGENYGVAVDQRAYDSAEMYDPTTGRFSVAARLPDIDRSALQKLGIKLPDFNPTTVTTGALLAIDDGSVLLVGNVVGWGSITMIRSFRLTGLWTEIGQAFISVEEEGADGNFHTVVRAGVRHADALLARLPHGRALLAGDRGADFTPVELFDPYTEAWSPLPPMPAARAGGTAVVLKDGSVLFVGGWSDPNDGEPIGLTSAFRFVPSP